MTEPGGWSDPASGPEAGLPDELLAARQRVASQQAQANRKLARARARRRVLPVTLIGSVVLAGAGLADRFVSSTVHTSSTPAAASPPGPTADLETLSQVSQDLAADQQSIAALSQSAAQASHVAAVAVASAAAVAAAATVAPATGANPMTSATASSPAFRLPTVAALPAASTPVYAAPVYRAPAVAAPAVHATTGASGAG
ncbi:MAG: hypothetical protein M0Z42_20235 [Actinomycetota bacterium]|jgi:hypothetical protein|nr:hypothetical protein [Actinomycetota bacterium]